MKKIHKILLWFLLGGVVLAGITVFAVWWFFFRDTSPPPPNLQAQLSAIVEERGADEATDRDDVEGNEERTADISDISGEWIVDTEIGNYDEGTSSYGGYRIEEELLRGIGRIDAVGRSPDISGSLDIQESSNGADSYTLADAEISIDLRSLRSTDASQRGRDDSAQEALETDLYPFAVFSLTQSYEIPSSALEDSSSDAYEEVDIDLSGMLTIHGITREVTASIQAGMAAGVIVVTGGIQIAFEDFMIEKPDANIVASIEDEITIEFLCNFVRS